MTRVLGAVLAGGQSRRFGSDKAAALLDGTPLIERVILALARQVEAVVVCGRRDGLADRPPGRLGPLAGINAALHAARAAGFDAVLSVPCDTPVLPSDLRKKIEGDCASYLATIRIIGFWPCGLADDLDAYLAQNADRSMHGWVSRIGAKAIDLDDIIPNINTPADLERLSSPNQ